MKKRLMTLAEVTPGMRPADVVLWEPATSPWRDVLGWLFGWAIARVGRRGWCHVDMVEYDPIERQYLLLGMIETGGRSIALADEVARYPGKGAWFVADADGRFPEFCRPGAVAAMRLMIRKPYGWGGIRRVAKSYIPFVRWFARADTDDDSPPRGAPFCSGAVARAMRQAGRIDPVLGLADDATEPSDLAGSPFYAYQAHLVP